MRRHTHIPTHAPSAVMFRQPGDPLCAWLCSLRQSFRIFPCTSLMIPPNKWYFCTLSRETGLAIFTEGWLESLPAEEQRWRLHLNYKCTSDDKKYLNTCLVSSSSNAGCGLKRVEGEVWPENDYTSWTGCALSFEYKKIKEWWCCLVKFPSIQIKYTPKS